MPKLLAQFTIGNAYTLEMAKSAIVTSSHQICPTLQRPDVLGSKTDAHSMWLEVHAMPTITAQATIQCLRTIFAQFDLPERVVFEQ